MVTQAPSRRAAAMAIVFVLSCVGLIIFAWGRFGGTLPLKPMGYRFHARFLDAGELVPHSDVRIAGVSVGKVVSVRRSGLRTDATIQLDAKYAPLRSDARAILRQKTLLGETFVALTAGSPHAPPLADGGRLPDRHVAATQSLDTVLGSFDTPTRRSLRRWMTEMATSLDGRGEDLNDAIGNLAPTADALDRVAEVLDRQRAALQRVVRDGGTVLQTVAQRRDDLDTLVGAGNRVLAATAARNRSLTATVDAMPPLLTELRATLRQLDVTGAHAAPSLHALRPVAPLVRPALSELISVAPAVSALMHDLGSIIPLSRRGLPQATAIVSALQPFTDELERAARQVTPTIELSRLYGNAVSSSLATFGAALEGQTTLPDGTPIHDLRSLLVFPPESVVGVPQRPGTNRHNPYPAPDALTGVGHGGIGTSDCRNAGNASLVPAPAPPCRVQAPLDYDGKKAYYPHVQPLAGG